MSQAPWEVWIEAVKDRCKELEIDYDEAASVYRFLDGFESDLTPYEVLEDYLDWKAFKA